MLLFHIKFYILCTIFWQNSPTPFVSGTKVPPPGEKNDNDVEDAASEQVPYYASDPDVGFATSDFPEVPKESLPSKYSY